VLFTYFHFAADRALTFRKGPSTWRSRRWAAASC
jgi:hypothetical protein